MNSFLHAKKICGIFLFALLMIVFKNAAAQVPVITTNPLNQTVCDGSDAVFTVVASNNPTSYVWQYSLNGALPTFINLSDNAIYSGSSTSTLTIHTSLLQQNLFYQCYAINSDGTSAVSSVALLTDIKPTLAPIESGGIPGTSVLPNTFCQGLNLSGYYRIHSIDAYVTDNKISTLNWTYTGTGFSGVPKFVQGGFIYYNYVYDGIDSVLEVEVSPQATSGVLSVVASNGCGLSDPSIISYIINPLQNALSDGSSCGTDNSIFENNAGGTFADASCNVIATVVPSGSNPVITGQITTCTTIDPSVQTYNGNAYVQRHYNIDLANNPNSLTATATVTLYFTQQDFDNFNAARGSLPALPTGPTDAAGISNIRVTQFHGAGTTPGTYVGSAGEINPDDNNIIWNASASRWEITFNITGFSGFFLSTASLTPLPLTLIDFKGTSASDGNLLQWITASEINVSHFEIERSEDGINYKSIGTINAIDNSSLTNNYSFKDAFTGGSKQVYYYRLNMVDIDGKSSYSKIIVLQPYEKNLSVKISPNPFIQQITATVISPDNDKGFIIITDAGGKKVMQQNIVLNKGLNTLQLNTVNQLSKGIYFLRFSTTHDAQTIKLIKEE